MGTITASIADLKIIPIKQIKSTNSFDFLRFFAATMVIISHSFILLGIQDPLYILTNDISIGTLGVFIFFIISGYLIAKSWDAHKSATRYFQNRLLRIIPGLICSVLFCILIVGPLMTNLSIINYLTNTNAYIYLSIILIFPLIPLKDATLPGVFVTNPIPYIVNGSLWTIPYEFILYIFLFLLGLFGLLYAKKIILFLFTIFIALYAIYPLLPISHSINLLLPINFTIFFLSGIIFYTHRDLIKYKSLISISLSLCITIFLIFNSFIFHYLLFLCLPYIVFSIAFHNNIFLNNFGKYGDFSYGMYIYAYPIQQSIVHIIKNISTTELFILSLILILPLSIISWIVIESKALELKRH